MSIVLGRKTATRCYNNDLTADHSPPYGQCEIGVEYISPSRALTLLSLFFDSQCTLVGSMPINPKKASLVKGVHPVSTWVDPWYHGFVLHQAVARTTYGTLSRSHSILARPSPPSPSSWSRAFRIIYIHSSTFFPNVVGSFNSTSPKYTSLALTNLVFCSFPTRNQAL